MPDKIRWGILGTGAIAKQFATGLQALDDAEIAAVGSRAQATADVNGDGVVDVADFDVIRQNYFHSNAGLVHGDTNGDQQVDHLDYFVWRTAFAAAGGDLAAISAQVPEPSSVVLLALLAGATGTFRRRTK